MNKTIIPENIMNIVYKTLNITDYQIEEVIPMGGMTNKNYKLTVNNEHFVLRIPGDGTDKMINRNKEMQNILYAHELGIDAPLIYFDPKSGFKISRFIENAETLSPSSAKHLNNMTLTINLLKKLHTSKKTMSTIFNVYEELEKYDALITKYSATYYKDYNVIKEKVYALQNILSTLDIQHTPCHNDLVAENLIKNGKNKMYLIDWEYAGMNDPMWDLAAHIIECDFNQSQETQFINLYFDRNPEEKYIKRIMIYKILQDFLWGIWTIIKEVNGANFGNYGINRYNRAKSNLSQILY